MSANETIITNLPGQIGQYRTELIEDQIQITMYPKQVLLLSIAEWIKTLQDNPDLKSLDFEKIQSLLESRKIEALNAYLANESGKSSMPQLEDHEADS